MYRMLWGFSQRQLEQGAADQLVQWLDHQSSDFRVAAIENLKEITGTPSLYLPHMTEKQRRSAVIRWKNRAAKGEIRYRKPPEIIMLLDKVRPPLTSESVPQPPKATGEGPVDGNDAL